MLSCARATNEMNHVAQKFTQVVVGTNNVDSCNRTCHAPSVAGLSAAFGSGGGTSSYEEVEHTDLIVMWGSNARFAPPIFFQHVLKGIRNGARMYAVDPRRTSTAEWAEGWLGLNVGTDIPLAHAIGREIIHAGLVNHAFVERATSGFAQYAELVEVWPLSAAEKVTGGRDPRARARVRDRRAGAAVLDAGHHRAPQRHRQRPGPHQPVAAHRSCRAVRRRVQPVRGQNNVQGGGDMGAIPNRLPGFQDILDPADTRAAGTWDEESQTETTTVCAYCGVGCNPTLHVQDNEIVKVTSPHDNPVTHGNLCIKGRFGYQHVQQR